jgi:hypothetical protein
MTYCALDLVENYFAASLSIHRSTPLSLTSYGSHTHT